MKKAAFCLSFLALCTFVLSVGFLGTGCEEARGVDSLYITPDSVTLSGSSNSVIFTVGGEALSTNDTGEVASLSRPLEWSVSNSGLGSITQSSGVQAVYRRTSAKGDNTVIVKDQYNNEGYATVSQQ